MKGVTKTAQKMFLHKEILTSRSMQRAINYRIKSENDEIYTSRPNKICLSAYDDKRFLFKNGIESLPYGHHAVVDNVFLRQMAANWDDCIEQVIQYSSGGETLGIQIKKACTPGGSKYCVTPI